MNRGKTGHSPSNREGCVGKEGVPPLYHLIGLWALRLLWTLVAMEAGVVLERGHY